MKKNLNEKGYTLFITLILIVLIFILTASFAVASMSQTKQISRTDHTFVATSLAEMGVEYYSKEINALLENRLLLLTQDLLTATTTLQIENFRTTHNNLFQAELDDLIATSKTVDGDNYYEVDSISGFVNTATGIAFNVKIEGATLESSRFIDLSFAFDNYLNPASSTVELKESTTVDTFQTIIDNYPHMVKTYSASTYPNHTNLNGQQLVFFPNDTSLGQLFNDGMIGINVFSKEELTFLKHTTFTDTQLEGKDIIFDFKSGAKAEMVGSIFKANSIEMQFNKNQALDMTDSIICINNPYTTTNSKFLDDIKFTDTSSRVYFQQPEDVATQLKPNEKYDLLSEADYKATCKLEFKYYDVESSEGDILDEIIYN